MHHRYNRDILVSRSVSNVNVFESKYALLQIKKDFYWIFCRKLNKLSIATEKKTKTKIRCNAIRTWNNSAPLAGLVLCTFIAAFFSFELASTFESSTSGGENLMTPTTERDTDLITMRKRTTESVDWEYNNTKETLPPENEQKSIAIKNVALFS